MLGDIAAYDHLIEAISKVRSGQLDVARTSLKAAHAAWPAELIEAGFVVSTARAMLWFDTAEELMSLRDEAEQLLDEQQ